MSGADRVIRWSTAGAVLGVAVVAAVVSYEHAYDLVRAHGESGWTAHPVPLTVDGLIYAPGGITGSADNPDPLGEQAAEVFADQLAAHRVPSVRAIRAQLHVGQPRASGCGTTSLQEPRVGRSAQKSQRRRPRPRIAVCKSHD